MQDALDRQPEKDTDQAYLSFIAAWTREPDFSGCLFHHACAEFSDPQSAPYQASAAHKQQIRQILRERLGDKLDENKAQKIADTAFLIGEGMIAAAQVGQNDLVMEYVQEI